MKSNFIDRVILGTLIIAAPLGIFCGNEGRAIFVGALWGSANLFILKHLVLKMMATSKKEYLQICLLGLLKCPILYLGGYVLLKVPTLSPTYLFIGFSLLFVMMALRACKVTLLKRA